MAVASEALAGRLLEHAIAALEHDGLRVFYSTDLVRPSMRVETEPESTEPAQALAEILAPHGLATRPGPQDSVLIVRDAAPRTTVQTPSPDPAAPADASPSLLSRPARRLEEVVVAASRYELRRPVGTSQMHFGSRDLEHLPDLGEDAIRAVARLPGTASNAFSAHPYIRGGDPNDTLVRLDGLRLYGPYHLKDFQGVFSIIDPRVVRSMDVQTGGYPAVYGDRMAGVIDIETIASPDALYHELGVSFFNLSVLSSGQFQDARGEWLASIRRSNLDLLYEQFSERPERPHYADAFGKLTYEIGDAWRISARVLRSEDDIALADDLDREETAEAHHSDRYAWLTFGYAPHDALSGSVRIAHTVLESRRWGATAKEGISTGALSDARRFGIGTLAWDWAWQLSERMQMRAGGTIEKADGRYDYADRVEFDLLFDVPGAPAQSARTRAIRLDPHWRRYALYANMRHRLSARVTTEIGLRWDEHVLDGIGYATVDPRLGLHYQVSERVTFRASWGRFHQSHAINELAVSDGETEYLGPEHAQHAIVGFETVFDSGLTLRVDLYEKRMSDLRRRYENLLNSQVLLPELKPDRLRVAPDGGTARGIELMLESTPGPMQWWLGYSWSRVRDRFGDVHVPRSWDQRHALTAGLVWDTPKWSASAGLTYRSGWPTTTVAFDDSGEIPTVVAPRGRNADRLGRYRTLDVRVARKIELSRSTLAVSFEIANVFDRENPCCFEYEAGVEDDEPDGFSIERLQFLPTIPSVGLLWKF